MAQSKRTAASYLAEQRNTTAGNPFMGKTLAEMKEMYSNMTPKQRGKNVETFRRAAAAAAKRSTNKSKVTTQVKKPTPKRQQTPTTTTTTKPTKPSAQANKGTGRDGKFGAGTYGKGMPSKTNLKSQPKRERKKNVRGSGVKKTGKKVNLGKTLQNLSDKFKLTRKAGEVFTVGNMRYVSDGKGGIRSSQRIR